MPENDTNQTPGHGDTEELPVILDALFDEQESPELEEKRNQVKDFINSITVPKLDSGLPQTEDRERIPGLSEVYTSQTRGTGEPYDKIAVLVDGKTKKIIKAYLSQLNEISEGLPESEKERNESILTEKIKDKINRSIVARNAHVAHGVAQGKDSTIQSLEARIRALESAQTPEEDTEDDTVTDSGIQEENVYLHDVGDEFYPEDFDYDPTEDMSWGTMYAEQEEEELMEQALAQEGNSDVSEEDDNMTDSGTSTGQSLAEDLDRVFDQILAEEESGQMSAADEDEFDEYEVYDPTIDMSNATIYAEEEEEERREQALKEEREAEERENALDAMAARNALELDEGTYVAPTTPPDDEGIELDSEELPRPIEDIVREAFRNKIIIENVGDYVSDRGANASEEMIDEIYFDELINQGVAFKRLRNGKYKKVNLTQEEAQALAESRELAPIYAKQMGRSALYKEVDPGETEGYILGINWNESFGDAAAEHAEAEAAGGEPIIPDILEVIVDDEEQVVDEEEQVEQEQPRRGIVGRLYDATIGRTYNATLGRLFGRRRQPAPQPAQAGDGGQSVYENGIVPGVNPDIIAIGADAGDAEAGEQAELPLEEQIRNQQQYNAQLAARNQELARTLELNAQYNAQLQQTVTLEDQRKKLELERDYSSWTKTNKLLTEVIDL